ncbi:MAG: T9SS type A sorting domain-containing protein [Chitinophagales bacterium]|nr:T9SS type A sorting domain-containing protein [Chitinophagales bacterium]
MKYTGLIIFFLLIRLGLVASVLQSTDQPTGDTCHVINGKISDYISYPNAGLVTSSDGNIYTATCNRDKNIDKNTSIVLRCFNPDGSPNQYIPPVSYKIGLECSLVKMVIDSDDNIYMVLGYKPDQTDSSDVQLVKYNLQLQLIWEILIASYGQPVAKDMTIDNAGNIWITGGYFIGSWGLLLITKIQPDGQKLFGEGFSFGNQGSAITTDMAGHAYVCGYRSFEGVHNFIAMAFDQDGNLFWSKSFDGESRKNDSLDIAYDCISVNGFLYVAGSLNLKSKTTNASQQVVYKIRERDGRIDWFRTSSSGQTHADAAKKILTDFKGNIYIAGEAYDNQQITLTKYDTSGNLKFTEAYTADPDAATTGKEFFVLNDFYKLASDSFYLYGHIKDYAEDGSFNTIHGFIIQYSNDGSLLSENESNVGDFLVITGNSNNNMIYSVSSVPFLQSVNDVDASYYLHIFTNIPTTAPVSLHKLNYLLYPTAAHEWLNISNASGGEIYFYNVYDQLTWKTQLSFGDNILNVSNLPRGIYMIKIVFKNKVEDQKIILL